jgi:choline dehydrogenase
MRTYFERLEHCDYLPNGGAGHGFSGWYQTNRAALSLIIDGAEDIVMPPIQPTQS